MNTSPILLIASDNNLRLSLCSMLERSHFAVKGAAYLCVQEVRSQENLYPLFIYAIHSLHDVNLACAYLQDDRCFTTPIIFLCEPIFAPLLRQASRNYCRVKILITPLEPAQIITATQNILTPSPPRI
jgi:hypothetical protein